MKVNINGVWKEETTPNKSLFFASPTNALTIVSGNNGIPTIKLSNIKNLLVVGAQLLLFCTNEAGGLVQICSVTITNDMISNESVSTAWLNSSIVKKIHFILIK